MNVVDPDVLPRIFNRRDPSYQAPNVPGIISQAPEDAGKLDGKDNGPIRDESKRKNSGYWATTAPLYDIGICLQATDPWHPVLPRFKPPIHHKT